MCRELSKMYRGLCGCGGPMRAGHELNADVAQMAQLFYTGVATGKPCGVWGEDDTLKIAVRERIDVEFRNPLFGKSLAELWRKK